MQTRAETHEIVPRYYGLSFPQKDSSRVFDNPSTVAVAYIAITPPRRSDGLESMLCEWQTRKPKELEGALGYSPQFTLTPRQINKLLKTPHEELVELVKEKIKANHGSLNLWNASGIEAVQDLHLRGELLTAEVKSQRRGWHKINLKSALRGPNGENLYRSSFDDSEDFRWVNSKGGREIVYARNSLHVKMAETDSYIQARNPPHHSRKKMREQTTQNRERSITFNFVDDPFLRHLVIDVLIAREVLHENAYSLDRKLLSPEIAPAIMPLSLQQDIAAGRAQFEIIKQRRKTRKIDPEILEAQRTINKSFSQALREAGFTWDGHDLELGRPANRYTGKEHVIHLVFNDTPLPFYTVRSQESKQKPIFTPDYGPQDPFAQLGLKSQRIEDKRKRETSFYTEPCHRINIPGIKPSEIPLTRRIKNLYKTLIGKSNPKNPARELRKIKLR